MCDVVDAAALTQCFDEHVEAFGSLEVVVNSAGVMGNGKQGAENARRTVGVNLTAVVDASVSAETIPGFLETDRVSSMSDRGGEPLFNQGRRYVLSLPRALPDGRSESRRDALARRLRDAGLLEGLGPAEARLERHVLAVERRLLLRPQRLHGEDVLARIEAANRSLSTLMFAKRAKILKMKVEVNENIG